MPSHESWNFQFRAEFFNVFNHPQFADPNLTFTNSNIPLVNGNGSFGNIRSTVGVAAGNLAGSADSRIIQLALKMQF